MDDQVIGDKPQDATRPRPFDLARDAIRRLHYSRRTEETYLQWIRRFILFSGKRHPRELGAAEVTAFLKDVDFGSRQILVRDGKGARDRLTMLPNPLVEPLQAASAAREKSS